MSRRFRVTANFPILGQNAHQTVTVEGSNWQVALGKAARAFKKLTVMHRRRVTALSMMVEQMEGGGNGMVEVVDAVQQPLSEQTEQSEQTVMEIPVDVTVDTDGHILDQQAHDEAERLIEDGPMVDINPEDEGGN